MNLQLFWLSVPSFVYALLFTGLSPSHTQLGAMPSFIKFLARNGYCLVFLQKPVVEDVVRLQILKH